MKYLERCYPRLYAWWHGHEFADGNTDDGVPASDGKIISESALKYPGFNRWGKPLWTAVRLNVAEKLWREGNICPLSGKKYLYYLSSLGLNSSMTALEVGARLGTFGSMVVESFGAYYTGLEDSECLRASGSQRVAKCGLSSNIPLMDYDRDNFEYTQRRVNAILIRELPTPLNTKQFD